MDDRPKFPHNYSSDRTSYLATVDAWTQLTRSIASRHGCGEAWGRWFDPAAFDGPLSVEGSPVCSLIHKEGKRGILIYPMAPEVPLRMPAYMQKRGDSLLGVEPVDVLVIHSSGADLENVEPVLVAWLSGEYSFDEMGSHIKKLR